MRTVLTRREGTTRNTSGSHVNTNAGHSQGPRSDTLIHEAWYNPIATPDLHPVTTREGNFAETVLAPHSLPTEYAGDAVLEDDQIPFLELDDDNSDIPSLDELPEDSDDESFDCEAPESL